MGAKGEPKTHQIIIPSDLAEVSGVQDRILKDASDAGFSEDAQFALKLCLDESVTNAIRHGNDSDPTRKVTISYTIDDQKIQITVCDEGQGFNPGAVPDPTLAENLERPSGRGVMLMAAYMTSVAYNDCGNSVTLVKSRDCKLPKPIKL
ncbi:MAG: ATP-binding protein [Phycisphaeraceae bacterium]